jgi:hypothetical protein
VAQGWKEGRREDEPEGDERDADFKTAPVLGGVVGAEDLGTDGGTAVGSHLREVRGRKRESVDGFRKAVHDDDARRWRKRRRKSDVRRT